MQDINKEFDLQLKEMFEDAEVQPSPRVWKNISGRLDSIYAAPVQNTAASYNWLKWAGVAFACAAIALGVFISFPELDKKETIELIAGNNSPVNDGNSLTAFNEAQREEGRKMPDTILSVPDSAHSIVDLSTVAVEESDDTAEEIQIAKEETTPPAKKDDSVKRSSTGEQASRYFAQLEYEEQQAEKRQNRERALYAKGMVGSNDGSFRRSGISFLVPGASSRSEISEISASTYGIPVSFGVGARFYVLPKLSIGTGLDCSILTRTFTGKRNNSDGTGEAGNVLHSMVYLGIPVNIYYDVLDFESLKVYAYGGGEVEYCVSNKYTLFTKPNFSYTNAVRSLQYSIGAGIGVEFSLSRTLGLYVDPGVRYYFPCNQPKSVRTDRPLMFNFDAGLRFNF